MVCCCGYCNQTYWQEFCTRWPECGQPMDSSVSHDVPSGNASYGVPLRIAGHNLSSGKPRLSSSAEATDVSCDQTIPYELPYLLASCCPAPLPYLAIVPSRSSPSSPPPDPTSPCLRPHSPLSSLPELSYVRLYSPSPPTPELSYMWPPPPLPPPPRSLDDQPSLPPPSPVLPLSPKLSYPLPSPPPSFRSRQSSDDPWNPLMASHKLRKPIFFSTAIGKPRVVLFDEHRRTTVREELLNQEPLHQELLSVSLRDKINMSLTEVPSMANGDPSDARPASNNSTLKDSWIPFLGRIHEIEKGTSATPKEAVAAEDIGITTELCNHKWTGERGHSLPGNSEFAQALLKREQDVRSDVPSTASRDTPAKGLSVGDERMNESGCGSKELGQSSINTADPKELNPFNLSQVEIVSKYESTVAYLSNPDNPWNHQWATYITRVPLPGEMEPFSAVTGEPTTASRRRPYSPNRLAQVNETRRRGACAQCRRRKQACRHGSESIASSDQVASRRTASERSRSPALERRDPRAYELQLPLRHREIDMSENFEARHDLAVAGTRHGRTPTHEQDALANAIDQVNSISFGAALPRDHHQNTTYADAFDDNAETHASNHPDWPLSLVQERQVPLIGALTSPEGGLNSGFDDTALSGPSYLGPIVSQAPGPIMYPHTFNNTPIVRYNINDGDFPAVLSAKSEQLDTENSGFDDIDLNWEILPSPQIVDNELNWDSIPASHQFGDVGFNWSAEEFDDLSWLREYHNSSLGTNLVVPYADAIFDGVDSFSGSGLSPPSENT